MKENRRGRRGHEGENRRLSHVDAKGEARMVDVGEKPVVARVATAEAMLVCAAGTVRLLKAQALPKGDVLAVARVAGIQGAKQAAGLIPLCHVLSLDVVEVDFRVMVRRVKVTCTVRTRARTGVEMEALMGAAVAALTLYDMCKAVDKGMRVEGVRVVKKTKSAG
jgi:cyclic pyranopterin phosphate synthase